ncbi:hypothetical protein [Thermoleptolyngbya sp.]
MVKQTLDKAHEMAQTILRQNRDLLESATQTLLSAEVLEGDTLATILAQVKAPEGLQTWLSKG